MALDGYSVVDGVVIINDDSQSTGRAACKRLGISWDDCVIWQGLPLMTENEERLGYVGSVSYDAETGDVVSLQVDKGASVEFLLGRFGIAGQPDRRLQDRHRRRSLQGFGR